MQQEQAIDYKQRYDQAQHTISLLQHELSMLKKMIFGSRHEKFGSSDNNTHQLSLDIKADQVLANSVAEVKKISYVPNKLTTTAVPHPGRHKIPEHLRREEIIIAPKHIPEGSKKIGQLETEVLEYKTAETYVKKYIRYKYLIRHPARPISYRIFYSNSRFALSTYRQMYSRPWAIGTDDHR